MRMMKDLQENERAGPLMLQSEIGWIFADSVKIILVRAILWDYCMMKLWLETHLREVAYCDVIKCQTLSGDICPKLSFKENNGIFASMFIKQWIKICFFFQTRC